MKKKILLNLKLMRLTNPTGYLLAFFPTFFGLLLATHNLHDLLKFIPLFLIGSVLARGAGCIINDICDKDFDKYVERTKDRPLANETLTTKDALTLLSVLLICSLLILLSLSTIAIYCGFFACIMMILYPLMKRITNFPQIFLGFTFNIGSLIAYSNITNSISIEIIIIYIACSAWTIGYDTIYGFIDLQDDKKISIKSMSMLLENRNYKFYLCSFYFVFIILFVYVNIVAQGSCNYIAIIVASILLIWQIVTLKIYDPYNCLLRFKSNNYVGIILSLAIL